MKTTTKKKIYVNVTQIWCILLFKYVSFFSIIFNLITFRWLRHSTNNHIHVMHRIECGSIAIAYTVCTWRSFFSSPSKKVNHTSIHASIFESWVDAKCIDHMRGISLMLEKWCEKTFKLKSIYSRYDALECICQRIHWIFPQCGKHRHTHTHKEERRKKKSWMMPILFCVGKLKSDSFKTNIQLFFMINR